MTEALYPRTPLSEIEVKALPPHPEYEASGPAEVAYWNGRRMPNFLRRLEVHVLVRSRGGLAGTGLE